MGGDETDFAQDGSLKQEVQRALAMHIAIDALLLKNQNAGTGFYAHHLLSALAELPSTHRFTAFVDAAYQKASAFESQKMSIEKVKLRGVAHRIVWEQLRLPTRLRELKVDVALYPFFIKPALSRVPAVVIIHDALIKVYPELIEPSRRWYLDAMIERSVRQAARIVAVSQYAKSDIVKHYGVAPERVVLAPAAAAPHFGAKLSEAERLEILRKCAVPFDRFFLSVGISHRYKNYLELLSAFKTALKENPALRLVMAGGDGNDSEAIEAFIERNALRETVFRARYVRTEDLRAFYASAVALVMTSRYESFGMPILEAMQAGCPVIVANRTAMPETAGEAGLMYQTEEELRQALLNVWSDERLRQTLAQKGHAQAKKFSWQRTAQSVMNALEESLRAG